MNVVVLSDYGYVSGGASQVAISSLNALADRVDRVIFVSAVGPVDESIDRGKVYVVNFGLNDLLTNPSRFSAAIRGIWDEECARKLGEVLANFDPAETVVHLHTWVKALSPSVVGECTRLGFNIVCTLHDYFSICPNGGLFDYQKRELCNLKPMSFECMTRHCDARNYGHKLWRVVRQFVQKHIGGIPGDIGNYISVSELSERLIRPYFRPEAHVYRIRNPIDVPHASPASPELNDGFIFVGRFSREKGGGLFAEAARKAGIVSKFAGSGDEEHLIRQVYPSAFFYGWLGREEVLRKISSSRALVFPSLWYETQGMVVSEAAALGVPSIVSDACAARDSIVDGETGLLFRAGDCADLAEKLRMFDNDAELAGRMGRAAYERFWSDPPTLEGHVKGLVECYRTALTDSFQPVLKK